MEEKDLNPFIRMFVALDISPDVRAALAAVQLQARSLRVRVGWVRPENLHVTLAFLGDVPRDAIPAITQGLDVAVRTLAPFAFETAGVSWFGGGRPRVVWAGITSGPGADCIGELAGAVRAAVRAGGYPDDEKSSFVAHITLGRLRPGGDPRPLMDFLQKRHSTTVFGNTQATGIGLMRSVLGSTGTEYSLLHECRFGGTPE